MTRSPLAELDELFDQLDQLLKSPDVGHQLAERGINISLAMVAAHGLRAYLHGDKERAHEDLEVAAEEIKTRLRASRARKGDVS